MISENMKQARALCRLSARFFFLMILFFGGTFPAQSQTLHFVMKDATVKQVFDKIEQSSKYVFFYYNNAVDLNRKVSIDARGKSVRQVLDQLFSGSGNGYSISHRQITVFKKDTEKTISREESPGQGSQYNQNRHQISGVVTDNHGDPLPGAVVYVAGEGSRSAVTADATGHYTINAPEGGSLLVRSMGFQDKTVKAGDKRVLNISMIEQLSMLNDVVVIGYGAMRKKDITTAVSTVSTKDIDERPIFNTSQAIQGKASGVQVVQPSGMPGAGLTLRVRGTTSVQASNEPLFVVDGLPVEDISDISPNDVGSIQILKDASSAAIYGARAANGVVLIETKRGQAGKTQIKFSSYVGFSKLGKQIKGLNTEEYKELMLDLKKVMNTAPAIPASEHHYTDWSNKFFKIGVDQNYQVSLSSGTDKLKYYVSGGFANQKGIVHKARFSRYNFRANIDNKIKSWLTFSLNGSYSHTKGNWINDDASAMRSGSILSVINTPPFMSVWSKTNPTQYDEIAYGARIMNPMGATAADNTTRTDYISGTASLLFNIVKGLTYKSSFGIDLNNEHWNYYLDPFSTSDGRSSKGSSSASFSRNIEWLFDNIVTYEHSFGAHHLTWMGGTSMQHARYNGLSASGSDMALSYPELHTLSAANQIDLSSISAPETAWSIMSFLTRINYNYQDKYLFTANLRADGSSRFAPGHRWGYFPSLSAGWRISSEKFFEPFQKTVNDLKLRAGWGLNGNQGGIGNYSYLASMSASRVTPTTANPYPGMSIRPYSAANKELTWEKTAQVNLGLDVTMFHSRLSFSLDAYYKKTRDLLLTVSLPDYVNLPGGIMRNDGEMENRGFELELHSHNFTGEFKWDTDFNISTNKNKLTKLGLNKVYYYAKTYELSEYAIILREGLPLGTFYGYKTSGVDPETGDIIYQDLNKNGHIDPGDRTTLGNAQPDFIYGLTNTFSWKGFGLSLFLQGSQGNKIFNESRIDMEGMTDFRNQSRVVLKRWRRPGMITDIPRAGNPDNNHNSDRFIEDGSYLRLKSLTFSYDFSAGILRNLFLSRLQLYVTAQNLFTLTRYKGFDPEVNAFNGSSVEQGVDYGTYPQSRAVIFGININL